MSTQIESTISQICKDILGLDELELSESFFDVGGTSIEAEQIASRISSALGVEFDGIDVLSLPSFKDMAELASIRLDERGSDLAGTPSGTRALAPAR